MSGGWGEPDPNWRDWDKYADLPEISIELRHDTYFLDELNEDVKQWCDEHVVGPWYFDYFQGGTIYCRLPEDVEMISQRYGVG